MWKFRYLNISRKVNYLLWHIFIQYDNLTFILNKMRLKYCPQMQSDMVKYSNEYNTNILLCNINGVKNILCLYH